MGKQKQYRHSVKLLPLAFLILVSNVLANDQSIQPKRNGIYLGTGLGVSYLSPSTRQVSSTAVDDKRAFGGQVTLGVSITDRLAAELHSADLGSARFNSGDRLNYHVHGLSGLFHLFGTKSRQRRFSIDPFLRLGFRHIELGVDGGTPVEAEQEDGLLLGAGLEINMLRRLGARLEAVSFSDDSRYLQAGLVYRFNRKGKEPVVAAANHLTVINVFSTKTVAPEKIHDQDRDQVVDADDKCPDTGPGLQVDEEGCALFAGVVQGVNFNTDSHVLTLNAKRVLKEVAITLKRHPGTAVTVAAHTDDRGTNPYNQGLSERRAKSVVNFLVQSGINGERLEASAYGEERPVESNATANGRASNRRVELFAYAPQ